MFCQGLFSCIIVLSGQVSLSRASFNSNKLWAQDATRNWLNRVVLLCLVKMAESRTVTVVPLNGTNYPTWKIQCRMALMKEGLWEIVTCQETTPTGSGAIDTLVILRIQLSSGRNWQSTLRKRRGLDLRHKFHSSRLKDED